MLLVVFCHAKFSVFAGGYIGVDLFFVISGYVVCASILRGQAQDQSSLKEFYARRLQRLAPSLYFVMGITLLICLRYCFPENNAELIKNIAFVSVFYSNIYLSKQTGYFDLTAEKHPLLHTWSLSVEEQFYLVVPMLLMLLKRWNFPVKFALISSLLLAFFLYSCHGVAHPGPGTYFYVQGRAFEFLIGILIAVFYQKFPVNSSSIVRDFCLLLGLSLTAWCAVSYRADTTLPGRAALWPCLGAALVIIGSQGARIAGALLSNKLTVYVGKISYNFYLWHWPVIFLFIRLELNGTKWMTAAMVSSLILAGLTHGFVEQPIRQAKWSTKKTVIALFVSPIAVSILLMSLGKLSDNFTMFYSEKFRKNYLDSGRSVFNKVRASACWSKDGITPEQQCTVGDTGSASKAVLWGDSHAYQMIGFIDQLGRDQHLAIHDLTFTMCAPIESSPASSRDADYQRHAEQCRAHGQAAMAYILGRPDIKTIFMSAVWDIYGNYGDGNVPRNLHGFVVGEINRELTATVARLEAAGKKVVFLDDVPGLPPELEDCTANRLYLPGHGADSCDYPIAYATDRYRNIEAVLGPTLARFPHTALIHTYDVACGGAVCHSELMDVPLYGHNDRGHLGAGGSAIYYRAYLARHPHEIEAILPSHLAGAPPPLEILSIN